jgi:hypothetical protein
VKPEDRSDRYREEIRHPDDKDGEKPNGGDKPNGGGRPNGATVGAQQPGLEESQGPQPGSGPGRGKVRRGPKNPLWLRPDRPPWFRDLRKGDKGRVIPDLRNTLIAVRGEPVLARAFAFNEMLQDSMLLAPLPSAPGALPSPPPPRQITVTRL